MSDITTVNVVYVSSSKNGDYVQATPHEGAVRYIRADAPELVALVDALREVTDVDNWRMGRKFDAGSGSFDLLIQRAALAQWEALQ